MALLSWLKGIISPLENQNAVQKAEVSGSHNTINQTSINQTAIILSHELTNDAVKELLEKGLSFSKDDLLTGSPSGDRVSPEDTAEVTVIVALRQQGIDGNNAAALKSLTALQQKPEYSVGYNAFRLNFNIGMVLHNMGRTDEAIDCLNHAYHHYPADAKARTGYAFSLLLEHKDADALTIALETIKVEGDHASLAASIIYHASSHTGRKIEPNDLPDDLESDEQVEAARLEYVRSQNSSEFIDELEAMVAKGTASEHVKEQWALHVLSDIRGNQAYLLGRKFPDGFEQRVSEAASILSKQLKKSLEQNPPNSLLLPIQANNAAVALRLTGESEKASRIIDQCIERFPQMASAMVYPRAILLLEQDREVDALTIIKSTSNAPTELLIMAAEIEASLGQFDQALARIEGVVAAGSLGELEEMALIVKCRIATKALVQESAEAAIEDLEVVNPAHPRLHLLKQRYEKVFSIVKGQAEVDNDDDDDSVIDDDEAAKLFAEGVHFDGDGDFLSAFEIAHVLSANGRHREVVEFLSDRTSLTRITPALSLLTESCIRAGTATIARHLVENLSSEVRNSSFGQKFELNVRFMAGEIKAAVPIARKLHERDPYSLVAIETYVQALLRHGQRDRIFRFVKGLDHGKLKGSIEQRCNHVKLLIYCGEIARARDLAYANYVENRNSPETWMALSASVLAFGRPIGVSDDFPDNSSGIDFSFSVKRESGELQKFTIESCTRLLQYSADTIPPDHPIAQSLKDKVAGDNFAWPSGGKVEHAVIMERKHKALDAFHDVIRRFEDKFPYASGFKSVQIETDKEDGLDELKAFLQRRAEYSQSKAREYENGSVPLAILAFQLGIDPVDAVLGLWAECNVSLKASSATSEDQKTAEVALKLATKRGVLLDAASCHIVRRMGIEDTIEAVFGKIAITQRTLDIYLARLQTAEQAVIQSGRGDVHGAGSLSFRDGRIVFSETSRADVVARHELIQGDVNWLGTREIVPVASRTDPPAIVARFRSMEGGAFLDDLLAADGSQRIFISEDLFLRKMGLELFGAKSCWLQSLLMFLAERKYLTYEEVVRSTLHLLAVGEISLSTNYRMILAAAEMLSNQEIELNEFNLFVSIIGQPGADYESHAQVVATSLRIINWQSRFVSVKGPASNALLTSLLKNAGNSTSAVLDFIQENLRDSAAQTYVRDWRFGHFL